MNTLAQFLQKKRDEVGLSPKGLAQKANVPLSLIEDLEAGKELFMPVTVRQSLAKVLKCSPVEIRQLEKDLVFNTPSFEVIESLKELILKGSGGLKCPVCGADLVTKVERMYDLEDREVFHPKAHCSKCFFQIS